MSKTKLPDSYTVTDTHRAYCLGRWGFGELADIIFPVFRDHHKSKGTKYADWDRAFQNWIRWSAPGGRFHNTHEWDRLLVAAKNRIYGDRKRKTPGYDPRGPQPAKPAERSSKEVARAAIAKIRSLQT